MGATPQYDKETSAAGEFVRQTSAFREFVASCEEEDRYHLYVSLACPWACRVLIARRLKQLESMLPVTVVDPIRDERGWRFTAEDPDPNGGFQYLAEAYELSRPGFADRVTVPVLWDKHDRRIVNNESSDLIRMLNLWSDAGPDLYPIAHRTEIDAINERVYNGLNNGVYRAGFATTQTAYEQAVDDVFATLDWLSEQLSSRRWLISGQPEPTEADWRTFVTLVRFDTAYVGHFKCNIYRIEDDPVLAGYLRDLYQTEGIAETVDLDQIKRHYYSTHPTINPTRIVPKGPRLDLTTPHRRQTLPT